MVATRVFVDLVAGLLYGVFLFSVLSIKIFTIGGNYYPEVAVVACILVYSVAGDSFGRAIEHALTLYWKSLLLMMLLLSILALIGLARGADVFNVYAELRSLVFLVVGFFFAYSEITAGRRSALAKLALYSSVLGFVDWLISQAYPGGADDTKYASPIFSVVVFGVLVAMEGRTTYFFISLLFSVLCAAIGFYRQYWIFPVALCLFGLVGHRKLRIFSSSAGLLGMGLLSISMALIFAKLASVIEVNESLYIQSLGKTNDLLGLLEGTGGLTESDALRQGYFLFFLERPFAFLLPAGLGSKSAFGYVDPWFDRYIIPPNTLDSIWFYMAYHFGLVLAIPVAVWFGIKSLNFLRLHGFFRWLLMSLMIATPVIFDGGAITIVPRALWFGALVGVLLARSDSFGEQFGSGSTGGLVREFRCS